MSWINDSPIKLGPKAFFTRYLQLAKDRFDKYFPGQWNLTKRLEELGSRISAKEVIDGMNLLLFLIDVAVWKQPHQSEAKHMIRLVSENSYVEIKTAFSKVWQALPERKDRDAIDAIGSLRGFGKSDGSRKIASAVLRFLDPSRFAVVDYRNWVILSNTEGQYFERPLLEPLAPTIEETRDRLIDTEKYLKYLQVIRELADQNGIRPADVDVAIFAFSDEIRPLSVSMLTKEDTVSARNSGIKDGYEVVKHQKMVEIVMRVVNDNKRARQEWLRKSAVNLEMGLKKCKTPHDIMQMCYNMLTRASTMDSKIRVLGRLSLADIKDELERTYSDP